MLQSSLKTRQRKRHSLWTNSMRLTSSPLWFYLPLFLIFILRWTLDTKSSRSSKKLGGDCFQPKHKRLKQADKDHFGSTITIKVGDYILNRLKTVGNPMQQCLLNLMLF